MSLMIPSRISSGESLMPVREYLTMPLLCWGVPCVRISSSFSLSSWSFSRRMGRAYNLRSVALYVSFAIAAPWIRPAFTAFWIACGYTDLRKGIDGLATLVQSQFQLDPFTNTLFLFCGSRKDRIKALYWEGNGFVLLYKRLESGSFQWPRNGEEVRKLTAQQYRWLMEGLQIDQPKAHKPMAGMSMV